MSQETQSEQNQPLTSSDDEELIPVEIETLQKKAEQLGREIGGAIEHIKKEKRNNQRRASYIKIATVVFTASITVLLGLQVAGLENSFKSIALILGAIVTMLNALEPYFNYRTLWIEHEAALANFHGLKREYKFYMEGLPPESLSLSELGKLNDKYQQLWKQLSHSWLEYRRGDDTLQQKISS